LDKQYAFGESRTTQKSCKMNPERPVSDIMTNNLVTVRPDTNANELMAIFQEHSFHHIPVVEKGGILVGIISKEDFFKLAYVLSLNTTGRSWTEREYRSLKAADIMTKQPVVLDPEDSIGLAADIFLANRFHALPVVDDHELVGMVTSHDLLLYSFNSPFVVKETGDMP
jgi:acetoin utilization protein AcuB